MKKRKLFFSGFPACRVVQKLRWFFLESKYRNRSYANKFFFCELLNLVNVFAQWFLLNIFLNGAFETYGREFLHYFEPEQDQAIAAQAGLTYRPNSQILFI